MPSAILTDRIRSHTDNALQLQVQRTSLAIELMAVVQGTIIPTIERQLPNGYSLDFIPDIGTAHSPQFPGGSVPLGFNVQLRLRYQGQSDTSTASVKDVQSLLEPSLKELAGTYGIHHIEVVGEVEQTP